RSAGDTTFINGFFDTDIAEAIGMMGDIFGDVSLLLADVKRIVGTTVGDTAVQRQFKRIVARLDTITGMAQTLVVDNKDRLNATIANLHTVTADIKNLLDTNQPRINTIVANGSAITGRLLTVSERIDSLIAGINAGQGTVGMLMKDEVFKHDLHKTVNDVDTLMTVYKSEGGLPVRVHLFGSSKPKKQPPQP
ncbi:MAG: hypothetical protein PHC61_06480, partial [Chitinivibrionales bacterium]|nr:hypothetical protein [Chitinivibrionales bacterium]